MFFGFCNAPPTFQAFMNHIFADMITEKWLKIYMDDLSIHTKDDLDLHHHRTCQVLSCLRAHGLSLKISKCSFDTPTMEYLGMIIGQGVICMDPAKLTAIRDWHPLLQYGWTPILFLHSQPSSMLTSPSTTLHATLRRVL